MFKAGLSKKEITFFEPNIGLFGFGRFEHRAQGVETPLFARALVIEDDLKNKTAIVVCEIGAIANSLKKEVLKKLHEKNLFDFNDENLLLSANHTHSAPGGFFHYPMYNFSSSGFHKGVLEKYAENTANAIVEANSKLVVATLSVHKGVFEVDKKVCFNRSLKAYNANNDVEKVPVGEEHLATDREMILLKIEDEQKNVLGCINWFGVHTTSCGNDHYKICSDNKGYAATLHEEKYVSTKTDFVSIYAQKPCGDITPLTQNLWIDNRAKKLKEPDYVHAAANGKLQFEKANEISNTTNAIKLSGSIDQIHAHFDFANATETNKDTKETTQITGEGAMGLPFFRGAVDGRGVSSFLATVVGATISIAKQIEKTKLFFSTNKIEKERIRLKYKMHSTKKILIESTQKRILGINSLNIIPESADKLIEQLAKQYKNGSLDGYPLTPSILPLQIVTIGQLAIVALPAEITCTGGKRLEKQLNEILKEKGIQTIVIAPYSNEFAAYITTPEEYRAQCYEGGHTLFGEQTL